MVVGQRSPAQLSALHTRLGVGSVKGLGLPVLTGQRQSLSLPGGQEETGRGAGKKPGRLRPSLPASPILLDMC